MFSPRLQQNGFTLLEILVTLAIVGIVASIALPSMRGVLGDSELSATSNHLVFSLQSARSEAIKRITPVSLCPSADPEAAEPACGGTYNQGWIVFVDANSDGVRDGADEVTILRGEALSPAFSVVPDSSFSNGVLFGISGVSTTAAGVPISGNIAISHAGNEEARLVRIAASGRISASVSAKKTSSSSASPDDSSTSAGYSS